jgi:uncharacterized protein YegL
VGIQAIEAIKAAPTSKTDRFVDGLEQRSRRLPIYLLLDCSESMQGSAISQINQVVSLFYDALFSGTWWDRACISVITFSSGAMMTDLIPCKQFVPPFLEAGGECRVGAALHLLADSIEQDLVVRRRGQMGDYHSLIYIFSGGKFTDDIEAPVKRLRSIPYNLQPEKIMAFAIGDNPDVEALRRITGDIYKVADITRERMSDIFEASIRQRYGYKVEDE